MKIEVDNWIIERIQELVPVRLTKADQEFMVEWVAGIGLTLVNTALEKNPDLTFGDLFMMSLKNSKN